MDRKKKQGVEISFFAAECMEFPNFGKFCGELSLPEAVEDFRRICKNGRSYGSCIGFVLKDSGIGDYSGIGWPFYQCGKIAKDEIQLVAAYQNLQDTVKGTRLGETEL